MSRLAKILALCAAAISVAAGTAACGTERVSVPKSATAEHAGAVLFAQRCAGCHTLSYAGTHGSAPNIRTAQAISGPNFDQRCERPITRVLYAIENGGFSGAYMPQNIVVGQDAVDIARFVATYAGRQAPKLIGVTPCLSKPVGTLPGASGQPTATAAASNPTAPLAAATVASATKPAGARTPSSPHGKRKRSSKKSAHA